MGKVVVAGGTGFLGGHTVRALLESGREVVVLTRRRAPRIERDSSVQEVLWDGRTIGPWTEVLQGAEAAINFSGAPVLCRWTDQGMRRVRMSRVEPTLAIARAIEASTDPPRVWLNASAVGFYGDTGDRETDESCPVGSDELASIAREWEGAASFVSGSPTRVCCMRIGFVLGPEGGAFPPLAKAARWFMGGRLGSGRQYVPWIHVADLARATVWCLDHGLEGPVNVVGPEPCSNAELMAAIRAAVRRPIGLPVPGFLLKLIRALTKVPADSALVSSRVVPAKLVESGFRFRYAGLAAAIGACLEPRA